MERLCRTRADATCLHSVPRTLMARIINALSPIGLICLLSFSTVAQNPRLTPRKITLANGKFYTLNLAEGYEINVAAEGLKRVRFMSRAPDDRIFVTDMFNLTDNKKGVVYILDDFDKP